MPVRADSSDSSQIPPYISISTLSVNPYSIYLERFSVPSVIGSTPKLFYTTTITPSNAYGGSITKNRVTLSDSLAERNSEKYFTAIDYQMYIPAPFFPTTNSSTINLVFDSFLDTTCYTMSRASLFDLLGVFLGWFQLFTMFLYYVFNFVNSFNIKLQICKVLFNNPEILEAKVSMLFYIKLVFVYALDLLKCRRCMRWFRSKGYLRQSFICFVAFERLDQEISIENICRSIGVLVSNVDPKNCVAG